MNKSDKRSFTRSRGKIVEDVGRKECTGKFYGRGKFAPNSALKGVATLRVKVASAEARLWCSRKALREIVPLKARIVITQRFQCTQTGYRRCIVKKIDRIAMRRVGTRGKRNECVKWRGLGA
jgi:hypothetical protein